MTRHHINIFWSDEDGCYVADIPDLRFCSAFGDTPEKALAEVGRAKEAWLEAARAAGKAVPEPRYRAPVQPVEYRSGRSDVSSRVEDLLRSAARKKRR